MTFLAALILLSPLAMAIALGLFGRRLPGRTPGFLAFASAGVSFLCAATFCLRLLALPASERALSLPLYSWISVGSLDLNLGILVDPLSATWATVVTGVGSLIFLYSISYMQGDSGYRRYFTYLCLFLFSMLILVLGENLVLTFLGWEGVGLCSYLLIGFEYDKEQAAAAGRKAFLVNRIGDVGFLLGMFWAFWSFGTLSHETLASSVAGQAVSPWLALCFFLGAVGKSAQAPLFVWLPDAMAGPTPVSALIHAATMVTAGVYLLCRLSLLFAHAGWALMVVAIVGAFTALLAAVIALRQYDLKRVLAYSTISQLGYMFLACGVGAFSAAAFHVTTHAFFKALLFLGAGAVIHGLSGEQDLRKMGGLKKSMPRTYRSMWFGALALAGIPPFAGFFSKDEILGSAFAGGHYVLWSVGLVTAALTAFYTARMMTLCFHGSSRLAEGVHPHEAPPLMGVALSLLKWLSLFGGLALGVEALHFRPLHEFLRPVLDPAAEVLAIEHLSVSTMVVLLALAAALALAMWTLAKHWYLGDRQVLRRWELAAPAVARWIAHRFYVDEAYHAAIVRPLGALSRLCRNLDTHGVDGLFRGCARSAAGMGSVVRLLQTGVVHAYALWFLVGVVVFLWITVG